MLNTVISDFKDEKIVQKFFKKELQRTNQKEFRVKKIIRRKVDKLYIKWKDYDSCFNSWIDKNYIV